MDAIEANLRRYLYPLWNRLASGNYMPPPVHVKRFPKGDGKERSLGIPTILDRVAQQVIRAELEDVVEPVFHPDSYGYRLGRGVHDALGRCNPRCGKQWYVIDLDIRAFFDTIDHRKMLSLLSKHTDKRHIHLNSKRWLEAALMKEDGTLVLRNCGTPQGCVISLVLANLYLHEVLDQWMLKTAPRVEFERYADDIVVHVSSREQAQDRLKEFSLVLRENKTKNCL
jgi:group II intron reverse transcriptase/maturase